ncbi:MAG: T9SS type A sorting domain-containing protein [Pyrinomonadaceae bacterium]|nr:T9SS type A sorting domain-containing protein [Sphingobacteriaceae bacterium]
MQKGFYKLSRIHCCLVVGLLCLSTKYTSAQTTGLVNNGATIVTTNTSHIYINGTTGNFLNQSGGVITNSTSGGTITLGGNWTNNAANLVFSNDGATAVFNSASAQSIAGTNSTKFYNITANGGGTKTFSTAGSVSNLVTMGASTIIASGGNLTLLATATTNANVAAIPASSSITGNVNSQVYFTGDGVTADYRGTRALSSPVTNATYAQLKNYMVITGANGGGFDPGGVAQSYATTLTKYTESATNAQPQFTAVTNITNTMTPGEGTFLFFRGDRTGYTAGTASTSNKVNAPFTIPGAVTMQYTGPLNQQNVVVSVPYTSNGSTTYDGYKLIGNPYHAVINWASLTKSNMEDALRIVKPTSGFVTYLNGVTANNSGISGDIRYILPGQGFYVKSMTGGGSVTFVEGAKDFTTAPMRLMSSPKELPHLSRILSTGTNSNRALSQKELRITLQNDRQTEEVVAVFGTGYQTIATNEDAAFLGGSSVVLSTLSSDNVKLTINFMPDISEVQELKLDVNATATGPVKLNFTDLTAADNHEVKLYDSLLNTSTDVRVNPVYDFEIDKSVPESYGSKRFRLEFKALPTLSFIAKKITKGAELTWSVTAAANTAKFEVERSIDGNTFANLGSVNYLALNDTYTFFDTKPFIGTNYYRVKQINNNGNMVLSQSAFLEYSLGNIDSKKQAFSLYPNPAIDIVNVNLNTHHNSPLVLTIHDLQGKELIRKAIEKDAAIQANVSVLISGLYVLKLHADGSSEVLGTAKFIKE